MKHYNEQTDKPIVLRIANKTNHYLSVARRDGGLECKERNNPMDFAGELVGMRGAALSVVAMVALVASACAPVPAQVATPTDAVGQAGSTPTPTEATAATVTSTEAATDPESETVPTSTLTRAPTGAAESLDHEALLDIILYDRVGPEEVRAVLDQIGASGDTRFVGGLIDTLRYRRNFGQDIGRALNELTGQELPADWFEWVEWAGAHPEIESFPGYPGWKAKLLSNIDPNFLRFLYADVPVAPDSRVEEIVWGGVQVDGIPALDYPKMIEPEEANYLVPHERVFGMSINGDTRAYPARFLDWHEMFNDVVGGEPVSLAY